MYQDNRLNKDHLSKKGDVSSEANLATIMLYRFSSNCDKRSFRSFKGSFHYSPVKSLPCFQALPVGQFKYCGASIT